MEYGTLEREIFVEASPEVVFEVVSSPDHLRQWWPDEAHYDPTPGSTGEIVFGDPAAGGKVVPFTVVDSRPPRTFTFRWTQPAGETAVEGNSLLVTFDLTPSNGGTLLRMTESGFREMGWEIAVLEHEYQDHCTGWDFFLARLSPYVATLTTRR
ncbi:SRPBCC domain-containing protein [Frankia sp. AgB32]|uniref:SRPBCC domain-containing protein n=1 Tax=Frankia sp. AgB32 TaxID=631119 RepID=UPI00200CBFFD|nr:SRPBCC domain-containing protein [Frankia sp. AgB32]MCK9898231.1 SRPBCC domain-containing protein [Frankia sp. AgB32]